MKYNIKLQYAPEEKLRSYLERQFPGGDRLVYELPPCFGRKGPSDHTVMKIFCGYHGNSAGLCFGGLEMSVE